MCVFICNKLYITSTIMLYNLEATLAAPRQGAHAHAPTDRANKVEATTWVFGDVAFRMWGFEILFLKPLAHISFGCEVPTPSVLNVNKLPLSNPTSSNSTSLNTQTTAAQPP